jgi:hypothetical protein
MYVSFSRSEVSTSTGISLLGLASICGIVGHGAYCMVPGEPSKWILLVMLQWGLTISIDLFLPVCSLINIVLLDPPEETLYVFQ